MSPSAHCLTLLTTIFCLLTPLKSVILFWVSLTLWKCRSKVSVIHQSFAPCHIIIFMWRLLKLWCHPRQSLLGVSCASYEQPVLGTPGLTADPYLQFVSQNPFKVNKRSCVVEELGSVVILSFQNVHCFRSLRHIELRCRVVTGGGKSLVRSTHT